MSMTMEQFNQEMEKQIKKLKDEATQEEFVRNQELKDVIQSLQVEIESLKLNYEMDADLKKEAEVRIAEPF